ncbi:MAG: hypothetical protein BroJett030_14130 [Alphaproteobacteria bacterium]|nr:MAG: hypothetical protein BroJett030_14130 [Alphaproteobacteria bacterium]
MFGWAVALFAVMGAAILFLNGTIGTSPDAGTAPQAAAQTGLPTLSGRVVDEADLIDAATEQAIVDKLAAFEARSSDQVVVATIVSLGGEPLEDYANRLFRHWGLGQAGENNGVLLLVARDDRKVRIEVGYGLEGTLTDALAKLIIEETLVPAFRAGEFARGIAEGTDQIIAVLSGDTAELEARARRNATGGQSWPVIIFVALWFGIVFTGIAFAILAPIFGRKTGKGRYEWLGIEMTTTGSSSASSSSGGFSGGGGSSGGGGASGSW